MRSAKGNFYKTHLSPACVVFRLLLCCILFSNKTLKKKKKKKKATGRLYNSHVHIKKLKETIFIILLECSLKIICMLNTHLAMMIIYKMRIKKAGGTCNFNQQ